jgi:hypothetical protein
MLVYPRLGQPAQVWYRPGLRDSRPLHGKVGPVMVVSRGPGPRNHGVILGGVLHVLPCGQLRKVVTNADA